MPVKFKPVDLQAHAVSLKNSLRQSQSDGVVIQMYLSAVQKQPDIVQDVVPNLPKTQASARDNAGYWNDTVWPSMTQTVTDVISFSNQWNSYQADMMRYAQQIASTTSGDGSRDDARRNLDGMLGQVYAAVDVKQQGSTRAFDKLRAFSDQVSTTNSQFDKELEALQAAYTGEQGVIATLDADIDQLNTGIGKDAALITIGGLSVIGGGLLIAAGAITDFITAGASTELVLAGIGVAAGGIATLAGASADLNAKIKALGDKTKQRSEAMQTYAGVKVALSQVAELDSKSGAASDSAKDLVTLWGDLQGDIDVLRKDIQGINPGDFAIVHAIQYASSDWVACLDAAQLIQTNTAGGNVPVKTGKGGAFPAS